MTSFPLSFTIANAFPMSQTFSSADDFLRYLDDLNFFHMDLSLDRMTRVLRALHLERPPYPVIQVVGTNGKGSTATFLASLLQAHGLRTGLYTSPHFVSPAERIQIDGQWTNIEEWLEPAARALDVCRDLTYFELLTVVAAAVFASRKVDCAVLEAGLGARYDATTALACDGVVYAPIALDHTRILGPDLASIAREKAHAIRSAAPVVSAPQFPQALHCLQERARAHAAPFLLASPCPEDVWLGLRGSHQRLNAGTALQAFRVLAPQLGITAQAACIARGLASAFLPGRLQLVEAHDTGLPWPCLLDGAHNPHGMQSLTRALESREVPMPRAVVYSCLSDKNWRTALGMLTESLPDIPFHIPLLPGERAEVPETIARRLEGLGITHAVPHATLQEAFATLAQKDAALPATGSAADRPVLVTGSLYLLAEFFALWPRCLHP